MIDTTEALYEICAVFAQGSFVTVDTEFLRETTYYPKLCLIQMANESHAVVIDPLAEGIDLTPFLDLMHNQDVVKVFHSARQDLEIIWNMGGFVPAPLFDTQVAAMVCGYGDSVSYEQLAHDYAKAKVDKSSRFTDWSRRPLSEAQVTYALGDVTHLVKIYQTMASELEQSRRSHWLEEEMAILSAPETYQADPDAAWKRLTGRIRKPKELAILIELAAWREREAQSRDVPRGRILKDDAVVEIATIQPRNPEILARMRAVPSGFDRSRYAGDVIDAVTRGLEYAPDAIPPLPRSRPRGSNGALIELLKVLLKAICENENVAPKIVASVTDLEALIEGNDADLPILKGWRLEVFGEKALALKAGQLMLGVNNGQVQIALISN
jgi:ribonuclease D